MAVITKHYKYKTSEILWLDNLPEHWEVKRLKNKIISNIGGDWGAEPESKQEGINVAVLRVADLDGIYFSLENPTIRKIKQHSVNSRRITNSSLVIEKSGGGEKQLVGRVGLPKGLNYEAICSNFMSNITFDNTVELKFVNYLFSFLYESKLNFPFVQQTTGIQNLNVGYYLMTKVGFPPLIEQKAISNYLDRVVSQLDKIIALKKEQLDIIGKNYLSKVQEVTTKGFDPSAKLQSIDSEWIDGVPEHWKVKRVKRVCNIFRGKFTHRPRNDPMYYGGEYPFIQTGNVSNSKKYIESYSQTLNELGLSVSQMFPSGTLCMTIAANIGDLSILKFDACFPDSIVGFSPNADINLDFLYYQFEAIKQDFFSTAIITTQMNLNIVRIGNVFCYIPPLKEQDEIVRYIANYSEKIEKQKSNVFSQIEILKKYRKSLIHECVTGKKQVCDPYIKE